MASSTWHFFRAVEVNANQVFVPDFSIVPNGTFLLEQPEPSRFDKMHQFAESQLVPNPYLVYRHSSKRLAAND